MKPTRRIVCGTDFSPNARAAADVAAAIAHRLRATLVLVHITDGFKIRQRPEEPDFEASLAL